MIQGLVRNVGLARCMAKARKDNKAVRLPVQMHTHMHTSKQRKSCQYARKFCWRIRSRPNLFVWQSSKLCCIAMVNALHVQAEASMQQEVPG